MVRFQLRLLAALLPASLSAQMIGGLVVDSATRKPLAGIKVTALDADLNLAVAEQQTDSAGVFYIQLRRAGAYRLKFDVVPTTLTLRDTLVLAADDYVERRFVLALPADPAFFEFQVDKQVSSKPGSVSLRYPPELRQDGITGTVLAQFVVDQTGLVERESIKILKSTHEQFSLAVRTALMEMKFLPAEVRGKPVRQLVQQPFNFCLTPKRNPDPFPKPSAPLSRCFRELLIGCLPEPPDSEDHCR
jgi:TonB family protein